MIFLSLIFFFLSGKGIQTVKYICRASHINLFVFFIYFLIMTQVSSEVMQINKIFTKKKSYLPFADNIQLIKKNKRKRKRMNLRYKKSNFYQHLKTVINSTFVFHVRSLQSIIIRYTRSNRLRY